MHLFFFYFIFFPPDSWEKHHHSVRCFSTSQLLNTWCICKALALPVLSTPVLRALWSIINQRRSPATELWVSTTTVDTLPDFILDSDKMSLTPVFFALSFATPSRSLFIGMQTPSTEPTGARAAPAVAPNLLK